MDAYYLNISTNLEQLSKINTECRSKLQKYLSKQIWNPKDREELLQSLSEVYLIPECTDDITQCFASVILDILERNRLKLCGKSDDWNFDIHQRFCIALSKSLYISADVVNFAAEYLLTNPFLYSKHTEIDEPQVKRARKGKTKHSRKKELVHAIYRCLQYLATELKSTWDWSEFFPLLQDKDQHIRWLALHSMAIVTGMSASQLHSAKQKYFTDEQQLRLSLQYSDIDIQNVRAAKLLAVPNQTCVEGATGNLTHTMKGLVDKDLSETVVAVGGILLPKGHAAFDPLSTTTTTEQIKCMPDILVSVPTTESNLHSIAMAVANGAPVLLEGPVGCGKTSLVEHLAHVTGRRETPQLMKIQLGDQTDSKTLQGTYRCTDVPGEFVWQPGNLTKAVTEGHWVLLEDLDYAPMDVISLLAPLLESGTLLVSGHGDVIKASPNFRIFATQRLLSSGRGLYKQHNTGSEILEKLWTKVNVKPLSKAELKQVICIKHPHLKNVADKLVEIYFLLAAGRHDVSAINELAQEQTDETELGSSEVGKFLSHEGRLTSTRDLLKWVSRVSSDYDANSSDLGNMVFQEALDCFSACLPTREKQLALAEAMGAKLNITKAKAEFYVCKYKPAVEITPTYFAVGRIKLSRKSPEIMSFQRARSNFAFTCQSVRILERVAVCVSKCEPVLLVGETGVGKTSSIQYLAEQTGKPLRVINMNQQSGSTDLLGGFKPVDLKFVIAPFKEDFEITFCETFSRKQNAKFLSHVQECFSKRRWSDLLKLMEHTQKAGIGKVNAGSELHRKWVSLGRKLLQLKFQIKQSENALAFTFIEGTLVKALKKGDWVLLDEINLASSETLECLSGLLESTSGSVVLMERGDSKPIIRHPDFRLFACMNPATDVGKKDLPPGIRNRFTEFFVDELEDSVELKILVAEYLKGLSLSSDQIDGIVKFYQIIRLESAKKLTDGTGRKPHFSLRTLCRSLSVCASNSYGNVLRSMYEAFSLSFLTQLDRSSHPIVEKLIRQYVIGKGNIKSLLKQSVPPLNESDYLPFEGYWLKKGAKETEVPEGYVLTPSVRANLKDLARVVAAGRFPVLLQGETSVGKTSLVTWLAKCSGNKCMRINNHEHTDLQEYIGCYAADHTGKLVFQEGVLVEAMRKGHWIILDELNLAPTDILEALNRLLDDNRELFIPETQETVKAHPKFMLFATQNPPGLYGGRKILSRAFRNRFIELHFDEIPPGELETILQERCSLPLSYCKKLVAVLLDLQTRRRGSGVFAGKQGFITLRDLFRWAERYRLASVGCKAKYFDWDQLLADNGYMLLAGRVRKADECDVIQEVLQKHLKRNVLPQNLFSLHENTSPTTVPILKKLLQTPPKGFEHVVWTFSMRRMAVLVGQALQFGEPVLLIGETGCGKTTVCQLYAAMKQQQLYSVNCHMHTESSDFLGGLRPIRQRQEMDEDNQRLFEWHDGPLVLAMKEGNMFLIDEISLADDSVLERLNSVLEPERTLLLAEKGSSGELNQVEQVEASEEFRVVSTMNPGGDYGKKELSPALRNRFTEIWCPLGHEREDLIEIIEHNLNSGVLLCNQEDGSSGFGKAMMDFVEWFSNNEVGKRVTISIRDLLSWTHFINLTAITVEEENKGNIARSHRLEPAVAYIHGACLVFLDALGSGITGSVSTKETREISLLYLLKQMRAISGQEINVQDLGIKFFASAESRLVENIVQTTEDYFRIGRFYISKGNQINTETDNYALEAPTTCDNAQRILRALQLPKPILLEGSPGVGKTSLIAAIAKASGHELIRINLSEQTDVSDLFGADLPVEGGRGGEFCWRDGPLLQALKAGHWIVLDELNLASQSVLEGLNACLDHRAEVYIPELDMKFKVQHEKTCLFACQNPLNQGGGRKGLPQSFLNRFTQVYIDALSHEDLLFITRTVYPQIPESTRIKMIIFNQKVNDETMVQKSWGQKGSPWEFNLRDVFRWADLMIAYQNGSYNPAEFVNLIYMDRMRTKQDKSSMKEIYISVFVCDNMPTAFKTEFSISQNIMQVGHSFVKRSDESCPTKKKKNLKVLHRCLPYLESLMKCIKMNWMTILVGSSGCGKTGLVHLLAELCGEVLDELPMNSSMDTTELLGGFEQADLKRHLEDIERKIDKLVNSVVKEFIISNTLDTKGRVSSILYNHSQCTKMVSTVDGATNREEVELMKKKMDKFEDLLQLLADSISFQQEFQEKCSEELSQCRLHLQNLRIQLEADNSTNQGGRFEWVDSVLVKAVREGHWLLIENVNFCSASVLDRLNAMLEPGGVLAINERGVVGDGIPVVKPHPNFRLIMTMDPKYGEISRAMRNRGVEVYMLGEHEGVPYSDHDLKQLLHGQGLVGKVPCETLMEVHSKIKQSVLLTKCCLADMLRAAELTKQQLQRGKDLKSSLHNSCIEVYSSSLFDAQQTKILRNIVEDALSTFDLVKWEKEHKTSSLLELAQWPNGSPCVKDWCSNVSMANIQQNIILLNHLISLLSLKISIRSKALLSYSEVEQGKKFTISTSDDITRILKEITCVLKTVLESSNVHTWKLLLNSIINSMDLKLGSNLNVISELVVDDQQQRESAVLYWKNLTEILKLSLLGLYEHPLFEILCTKVKRLLGKNEALNLLDEQPFDLRHSPRVLNHINQKLPENERDEVWTPIFSVVNQLYLVTNLIQNQILHRDGLSSTECSLKKIKKKELSPLQISYCFMSGMSLNEQQIGHESFLHLYNFIQLFDQTLLDVHKDDTALIDANYVQMMENLSWYELFVQQCRMPLKYHPVESNSVIPNLCLHWNWLYNNTLVPFMSSLSLPKELLTVIKKLNTLLGMDHIRSKLFKVLWDSLGHPLPYQSPEVACGIIKILQLCQSLTITTKQSAIAPDYVNKVQMWSAKGCELKLIVSDALLKLRYIVCDTNEMDKEVVEEILDTTEASIEQLLEEYCIHQNKKSKAQPEAMITDTEHSAQRDGVSPDKTKLAVWPLVDAEQIWTQLYLLGKLVDPSLVDVGGAVKKLVEFQSCQEFVEPQVLDPWNTLLMQSEKKVPHIQTHHTDLVLNTMLRLTSNSTLRNPDEWFVWNPHERTFDDGRSTSIDTICSAVLSHGTFTAFSDVEEHFSDSLCMTSDVWLPESITLGQMDEKMAQLKFISEHLCRHLGVLTSECWSLRKNLFNVTTSILQSLLKSCSALLHEDCREAVVMSICQLSSSIEADVTDSIQKLSLVFNFKDLDPVFPEFAEIVSVCLKTFAVCLNLQESNGKEDTFLSMVSLGKLMVLTGLIQAFLMVPQGPVDPAQETAVLLKHSNQELDSIETELCVRNTSHLVRTGLAIDFNQPDNLHPLVKQLVDRKGHLQDKVKEYSSQKAARPSPSQFEAVLRETKQYLQTNGAVSKIKMILTKLEMVYCDIKNGKSGNRQILNEILSWNRSVDELLRRLQNDFPMYNDLLVPFMAGVVQTQVGLQVAGTAVRMLCERLEILGHCNMNQVNIAVDNTQWLEKTLTLICRFPFVGEMTQNSLKLAQCLISNDGIGMIQTVIESVMKSSESSEEEAMQGNHDGTLVASKCTSRILRSCLHLIKNHTFLSGNLNSESLRTLHEVLSLYVASWQQEQVEKKQRELEQESLYKYKEQSHGEELKEDEKDERDRKRMFPTYDEDFEDIKIGFTLDDKPKSDSADKVLGQSSTDVVVQITEEEVADIKEIHNSIFTSMTSTSWYKGNQTLNSEEIKYDYVGPAVNCYQVASTVSKLCWKNILQDVDGELVGAHLLFSSVLQNSVEPVENIFSKPESKPFDIYFDPNVPEAIQCRPMLERFRCRTEELLGEWTEHPTLKELLIVIDRVMAFPVTSPLMKFVTGIEVLVQKAEEWESNAARHVSVKNHIDACTQMIIQWRKLELHCWKTCLDGAVFKAKQRACKWWFYLYQLIGDFIEDQKSESDTGLTDGSSFSQILKALQKFMESSTVGEFKVRLDLIHAFLLQLVLMDASSQDILVKILWNVHTYYKYYLSNVEQHIARLRSPIEKELKNFVKIARWNDLNFYAMKQAVEKTHKTLHKHVKEFKKVLQHEVRLILVDNSSDWAEHTQNSATSKPGDTFNMNDCDQFCLQQDLSKAPVILQIPFSITENSILHKLPSLSVKVNKHARNILRSQKLGHLVQSIDEFTGELIESVHELQSLDVTQTADKEKQKSQAKHIHQRKRKALADLFKYLQSLGLSYKKGLVHLQDPEFQKQLLEPLNILASGDNSDGSTTNNSEQTVQRCWQGCEKYQIRCIARTALLYSSLNEPSKELGPSNIERCKGFSAHLSSLVTKEWEFVASVWNEFIYLVKNLDELRLLNRDVIFITRKSCEDQIQSLKALCEELIEFLSQLKIVLQCFPKKFSSLRSSVSPLPEYHIAKLLASCQDDELWKITFEKVSETVCELTTKKKSVNEIAFSSSMWISGEDVQVLKSICNDLTDIRDNVLISVKSLLVMPETGEGNCLTASISHLECQISKTVNNFVEWLNIVPVSCKPGVEDLLLSDDCMQNLESMTTQVLLGVQNLVKLNNEVVSSYDGIDIESETLEGHLTKHVIKNITDYIGKLKLTEVTSAIKQLLLHLSACSSEEHHSLRNVLHHLLPVMDQYVLTAQYFIVQAISGLRSSAKLLSVLLGVFSELVQKGFCLPAEYSDEVEGEGATEFKDIEGGGLGDGEGVKDVSDQIESEDQLDETQKNSDEKQEDDTSKQPDVKPEDNAIEMSDDFDGKTQDLEARQEGEESDSDNEPENKQEELDKQMGDLEGTGESEKLDEQIWGSDDEDEIEKKDNEKEEFGPGAGQESQPELVAKDDNQDKETPDTDKKDGNQQEQGDKDEDDVKEHELEQIDEREFDENEVDPYQNQEKEDGKDCKEMELPENIDLDNNLEEPDSNDKDEQVEENQFDIDKMVGEEEIKSDAENDENQDNVQEEEVAQENEGEEPENGKEKEDRDHDDMEVDELTEGDQANEQQGLEPQDDKQDDANEDKEDDSKQETESVPQASEHFGKTSHDTQQVQEVDGAKDAAGKNENEQEEQAGVGASESQEEEGHHGEKQTSVSKGGNNERHQQSKRKPGMSKEDRSLGSEDEKVQNRLKTVDNSTNENDKSEDQNNTNKSDLYEHIKDSTSQHDAQTRDAATAEQQQQEQPQASNDGEDDGISDNEEVQPMDDEQKDEITNVEKLSAAKMKSVSDKAKDGEIDEKMEVDEAEDTPVEIGGEKVVTHSVARGESSIHTAMDYLDFNAGELDIDKLRHELEKELQTWNISQQISDNGDYGGMEAEMKAAEVWQKYETMTAALSQELCEQLRLVLEPSQASKLRGDYRTGKRLNMRKVIPYIASQFRKDKIWLRRTKPSKRNYQILLAVDDSSSMADNHSKQLAFESLATIANALTLLEVGQLSICSFGETVKELHSFQEQFSSHSGAKILQQFTFEQKKTKIAQMLQRITAMMVNARSQHMGQVSNIETSQLLLIVSDGRGLFLEGMEVVKSAVRQAREANVFVVFVVLDNPLNKDSILDIRVPVFKGPGQIPEIKSYMDHFPFPFYMILRDINMLPNTLSDALRQWFELVTGGDR